MQPSRNAPREKDTQGGRRENAVSFDAIVSEALERMRQATAAPAGYEVDRSSAQWTVRRAATAAPGALDAQTVVELTQARRD